MHIKESFLGGRTIYEVGDKTFYIKSRAEAYARAHGRANPARVLSKARATQVQEKARRAPYYGVSEAVARSTEANRKVLRALRAGKTTNVKFPVQFIGWLSEAFVLYAEESGMPKREVEQFVRLAASPHEEAEEMMTRYGLEHPPRFDMAALYARWLRGDSYKSAWPDIRRAWSGVRGTEKRLRALEREADEGDPYGFDTEDYAARISADRSYGRY